MVTTSEFHIAPSATAAQLARQWLWRRWPFLAVPVVALLLAGVYDVRFVIVALMFVLIVWPMVLSFVWFGRALAPDAVRASCPHVVRFSTDGITVVYAEREGYATPAAESVPWADVVRVEDTGRAMELDTVDGRRFTVPLTALAPEEWREVWHVVCNKTSR